MDLVNHAVYKIVMFVAIQLNVSIVQQILRKVQMHHIVVAMVAL
jgi:hypothetical protein